MAAVSLPRLRVGIFTDSPHQPRWAVEALARAGASPFVELALASTPAKPGPGTGQVLVPGLGQVWDRCRKSAKPGPGTGQVLGPGTGQVLGPGTGQVLEPGAGQLPILWRAYAAADRAFWRGDAAEDKVDATRLVGAANHLRGGPHDPCWRARVAEARLDVAFVLGNLDAAAIAPFARYGAWRFCFGEAHGTCESMAAVREAIENSPIVASGIRITRPGKADRVACRSASRTFLSVAKSRAALFAKMSDFPARALRDLRAGGERWIELGTEPAGETRAETFPDTPRLLKGITGLSSRVVRRAAEKALKLETWSIAYRFGSDDRWDGALDGFFRLEPPKGWYWADPFPIERDGRYWIFFEELPLGAAKAHISVVEVRRDGTTWGPVKVLERPYHLSYPFLVEEGGELYMIPETADNNTVEAYRCVEFPAKWKLERTLLSGVRCVDATFHREDGRWWMFANAAAPGAELNDELALFSAESLLGEWRPHRRNPVKSDVRSARPAGRLFRRADGLYRPGQICTPLYGAGIALHRVTRLTADDYAEEEADRIVPRDGRTLGIHTFNRAGELTVADAFERHPRF